MNKIKGSIGSNYFLEFLRKKFFKKKGQTIKTELFFQILYKFLVNRKATEKLVKFFFYFCKLFIYQVFAKNVFIYHKVHTFHLMLS